MRDRICSEVDCCDRNTSAHETSRKTFRILLRYIIFDRDVSNVPRAHFFFASQTVCVRL